MGGKGWLAIWLVVLAPTLVAAPGADSPQRPTVRSPQVLHAVLQAITRAGDRLVAVGERGIVLLSDDNGTTWRQSLTPVSSTLTAVQFVDARQGWVVGHAGVVLHSSDAGDHWTLQLDGRRAAALELSAALAAGDEHRIATARQAVADGADKPFLALSFSSGQQGLVVGAYGMALSTRDGGKTWSSWSGRLPNPHGLHVYAVAERGRELYLAGEQGLLLRSLDGGEHFEPVPAPYQGSYFSMIVQADGTLLLAGLRGKVFRSLDQGRSFQVVQDPAPISINAMRPLANKLLVVNQAGSLLQTSGGDSSLSLVTLPPGPPLTDVAQAADGSLVGVGFAGPMRLLMPTHAAE